MKKGKKLYRTLCLTLVLMLTITLVPQISFGNESGVKELSTNDGVHALGTGEDDSFTNSNEQVQITTDELGELSDGALVESDDKNTDLALENEENEANSEANSENDVSALSESSGGIITGFDALDTDRYGFKGEPNEEQISEALPKELSVYIDNSSELQQIPVKWEAVEDFADTDFYFYSMKPVWSDDYKISSNLSEELDVPWVTVFREESEIEELKPITHTTNLEELNIDGEETSLVGKVGEKAWSTVEALTESSFAANDANTSKVYSYLTKKMGLNKAAACGVMTNIFAESGMIPNNLENTYNSRYGLSDAEYTKRVDAGKGAYKTSRGESRNFKTDYCGYGLCQWTATSRRAELLKLALNKGVSVSNIDMQLEHLNNELKKSYPGVLETLKRVPNNAAGAYIAAAEFCMQFEIPANTVSTAQSRGRNCLSGYWKTYNGSTVSPTSSSFTSLCGYTYPKTLVKGKGMSCSGYAISNVSIKTLKGQIINDSGNTVYSKSFSPSSVACSIGKLDDYMLFSKLSTGSYTYKITATDSKGKTVTASHKLNVVGSGSSSTSRGFASVAGTSATTPVVTEPSKPAVSKPAESKLKISSYNYPNKIKKGKSFSIKGKVTSNYNLKKVTVGVYTSSGKAKTSASTNLKGTIKSYSINKLDNKIKFRSLKKGTYYYKVKATDSKKSKTLLNKKFTVY